MPTFPTATTLTAAQLTGATVIPLSKSNARNEITVADLFGAGTVDRLAIYDTDGKLVSSAVDIDVVARRDTANTFVDKQTVTNQVDITANAQVALKVGTTGGFIPIQEWYYNGSRAAFVENRGFVCGGTGDRPAMLAGIGYMSYADLNIYLASNNTIRWTNHSDSTGAHDLSMLRSSAGVLQLTDASVGYGSLIIGAYSSSTVALKIHLASGQTANGIEQRTSGNAINFAISSAGNILSANTAAATTPGTVVKKLAFYDETGTIAGYVPLYDAIT